MTTHPRAVAILCSLACICSTATVAQHSPGLDRRDMDLSVRPGDGFYRYANGGWLDRTTIPPAQSSYRIKDVMLDRRDRTLRTLIERAAADDSAEPGSPTQQVRDFYRTAMDVARIEAAGTTPLREDLAAIAVIATTADLVDVVARFHAFTMTPLFRGSVRADLKNPKELRFYLGQAGLGLPDREYYTADGERPARIRAAYREHVARMLCLLGEAPEAAAASARAVVQIETRLARASRTRLAMRDTAAIYNLMDVAELARRAPGFDWSRYFAKHGEIEVGEMVVAQPEFFVELGRMSGDVPIADWRAYLRWCLVDFYSPYLGARFRDANFDFFGRLLSGRQAMEERWQQAVRTTNSALSWPVARLYVERNFPPRARQRMLELVGNLKRAFEERLRDNPWMSSETRAAAIAKLRAMRIEVGYPEAWPDYRGLEIAADSFVANVERAARFARRRNLARLGAPDDPGRWHLLPQTPNAGYNPLRNEVDFPAAMLQPPVFDLDAEDALNYGSIGVGIAHEMVHGFDDRGRRFDAEGRMHDWWTKEDAAQFEQRAQLLIEQFDGFVAIDDLHVNGRLSLGENVADAGGLAIAFQAYERTLEGRPTPPVVDGFTHVQRFFLAYARFWRGKIRDAALRRMVVEDQHPWGEFRVDGALFNMPEFYRAFDIPADARLYRSPAQRPVIW